MKALKLILKEAGALFFDHRCVACQNDHGPLCQPCLERAKPVRNPCLYCGYPTGVTDTVVTRCAACKNKKWRYSAARSLFHDAPPWREVIREVKFAGRHALLRETQVPWGAFVQDTLENFPFEAPPVITFVPGQASRQLDRSVLLSEALARQAGQTADLPVLPLLAKTRATPPQMQLGAGARAANLRGAFAPLPQSLESPWPKEVVLVDDLITTGHTVNECSRALKKAGSKTILVMSLARAVMDRWQAQPQ